MGDRTGGEAYQLRGRSVHVSLRESDEGAGGSGVRRPLPNPRNPIAA